MKPGSKLFYEIMDQFEKDAKQLTYGKKLDREEKGSYYYNKGYFYSNGDINTMFQAYLLGYQYARLQVILGEDISK